MLRWSSSGPGRGPATAAARVALLVVLAGCGGPVPVAAPTPPTPGASPSPVPTDPSPSAGPSTAPPPSPRPSSSPSPSSVPRSSASPTRRPAPPAARAGLVFVLDAGHNGGNAAHPGEINRQVDAGGMRKACNTVGTETAGGYPEHAFTFDVVTRTAAVLRAAGATVVLTRTSDDGVGPCIDARARAANAAHPVATLSVHGDGGPPGGRGFHVIAPALAPDGGNAAVLDSSYALGLAVRDAFRAGTGEPYATYTAHDGIVRRSDLGGTNLARVPTVFLECANLRNATDAARVTDPAFRQRAAEAIAAGLLAFARSR